MIALDILVRLGELHLRMLLERLREVVQTKLTQAQSLHARFSRSDKGSAALTRFLTSLFAEVFEFKDLAETAPIALDERVFRKACQPRPRMLRLAIGEVSRARGHALFRRLGESDFEDVRRPRPSAGVNELERLCRQ